MAPTRAVPSTTRPTSSWNLTAALEALRAVARPVLVVSDSRYVIDCFEKEWYVGWEQKGWKNASKQPVANQDLWVPLIDEYRREGGQVEFRWVRGHAGDAMNEVADRLRAGPRPT